MPAEIGNKYAEKWTRESVIELTTKLQEILCESNIYTLSRALRMVGLSKSRWSYLINKFQDDPDVLEHIKDTEGIIEENLIQDTQNGTAKSAAMSIFLLKSKYGYREEVYNINENYNAEVVVESVGPKGTENSGT